jgi:hypothetical protein
VDSPACSASFSSCFRAPSSRRWRQICGGFRSSEGKLKHLGITAPARSTLADANEHRPWQLYRAVFQELLGRCQAQVTGRRKFRFKNTLVSLDSTVIDLCATEPVNKNETVGSRV